MQKDVLNREAEQLQGVDILLDHTRVDCRASGTTCVADRGREL